MPPVKPKKHEIEMAFRSVNSLFEANGVKRMWDLARHQPTKITKALGINEGRYIVKLGKPDKFTINEIVRFSILIGADCDKVIKVILKEVVPVIEAKEEAKRIKSKSAALKKAIPKTSPKPKPGKISKKS